MGNLIKLIRFDFLFLISVDNFAKNETTRPAGTVINVFCRIFRHQSKKA